MAARVETLDRLLLQLAAREGATELHLKVGSAPLARIKGVIELLGDEPRLDAHAVEALVAGVYDQAGRDAVAGFRDATATYSLAGVGRFRVSAFAQRGSTALIVRAVPTRVQALEELGLPGVLTNLAGAERGLVVVAGPPGAGVTTTLGAMVDHLNHTRACYITTVEDPIELLHRDVMASVIQRQVGCDVPDMPAGISSALSHSPDVVVADRLEGEESILAAVRAAQSGCLVLAGLRAASLDEALASVVGVGRSGGVNRVAVAAVLEAVVALRLVATPSGRMPVAEIMRTSPSIQAALAVGDLDRVRAEVEAGAELGMQTHTRALADMLDRGIIDELAALGATDDWDGLTKMIDERS